MITIRQISYLWFLNTLRNMRLLVWKLVVCCCIFIFIILCIFIYYSTWSDVVTFLFWTRLLIIEVSLKRLRWKVAHILVQDFFTLSDWFHYRCDRLRLLRNWYWFWFWFWDLRNRFFRSFCFGLISGQNFVD